MRHSDVPSDLRESAFELFFWFSRFEFALKQRQYLKDRSPGARAEPGWQLFIEAWEKHYELTPAGAKLIEANPQRQVVDATGIDLEFVDLTFTAAASNLQRVVRLAQTVRNNLFHGGKHGDSFWDDPARMLELLPLVIVVLNELAALSGMENDYYRYY